MLQSSMISGVYIIVTLLTSAVFADEAYKNSCPTVTKTTTSKDCPAPTPAFCPQPQCILLKELDVPCGCPKTVPTETDYIPCTTGCHGGCGTAYETNLLPCSTPSPTTTATLSTITTKPVSCVTITKTDGPNCSKISPQTCITLDCIFLSTVTNPCGCTGIVETTSCRTTCPGGCATSYQTLFLPCPFSPTATGPVPTVSATAV